MSVCSNVNHLILEKKEKNPFFLATLKFKVMSSSFIVNTIIHNEILTSEMCSFLRMVLKSIGYKSIPVDGLPFDHRKGITLRSNFSRTS